VVTCTASYKVGIDNTKAITDQLNKLASLHVYVGVPESEASRPGEPINNAELAYIQSNGSPLNNIPARPILEPVIKKNEKMIGNRFQALAKKSLSDPTVNINDELSKIGMIVRDKVKDNFTNPDNGWAPNAPATIAAKGSDKPLIDTASLRKSIEYVVAP
jgi:hypothetical protein